MAVRFLFQIATLLVFWILWPTAQGSVINYNNPPVYEGQKVIMDVDAGADDAVAMLLLLSPAAMRYINVIAITCVNGNTGIENVLVNVLKTLETAKRLDIPVYRGSSRPLLRNPSTDNFFGKDGFGDFFYPNPPDPAKLVQNEHAVSALIRLVSQNPGQVTLLAVGPLTNVALALRLYPNFLKDLKKLVVLGGSVNGVGNVKPAVEFNFYMDPEAADIVFKATEKHICLVPWETVKLTSPISMEWRKEVLGKFNSPAVDLMNKAERISLKTDDQWISADTFAALYLIRRDSSSLGHTPTLCGGRPFYAQVVVDCQEVGGVVLVDYANNLKEKPNIEIIEKIDTQIFKDMAIKLLGESYA